jgi:hypothetical protein
MKRCGICGRELDRSDDPLSIDCGGDCWGCISEIEVEGTGVDLESYRRDPGAFFDILNPGARKDR